MKVFRILIALFVLWLCRPAFASPDHIKALDLVKHQLAKMCDLSGGKYPTYTVGGKWKLAEADDWTAGYFPAMMWMLYEHSGDPAWRERARRWTDPIAAFRFDERDLDFGLSFLPFRQAHRLTGDARYREQALDAAATFARRYNFVGRYLPSWGRTGDPPERLTHIIIDALIDLDFMFWAAREESNPLLFEMAHNTALAIMRATVRNDGSSVQVVELDPMTGLKRWDEHKQAHSVSSCWARGQAWGIYGLAEAYRNSKDHRFLTNAQKLADYYVENLPADFVPYWDFLAPGIPNEPKDSSAASMAAAGLLELSRWTPDPDRRLRYLRVATNTIASLTENYLATGKDLENGRILLHGTLHKPAGIGVDESMIFGDYYYLEALLRLIRSSGQAAAR